MKIIKPINVQTKKGHKQSENYMKTEFNKQLEN